MGRHAIPKKDHEHPISCGFSSHVTIPFVRKEVNPLVLNSEHLSVHNGDHSCVSK
jgi:hypothetical protein